MSCAPSEFLALYFAELDRRGIPNVVLHSYEALPDHVASDVDYAVPEEHRESLLGIQKELAAQHGWVVAQVLRHQVFAAYHVLVQRDDPRVTLKLDACSHYVKDRCLFIHDSKLLDGRRPLRCFHIPAPAVEFAYVLAKVVGKNKDATRYFPRLENLFSVDPGGAQAEFERLAGKDAGKFPDWLKRGEDDWAALNRGVRELHAYNAGLLAREFGRIAKRVLRPTGLWVSYLGVDGAGKSTQIENFAARECFRNVRVFHFRPMVFEQRREAVTVTDPHGQPPRSVAASWLKMLYYFADFWLGWLVVILPACMRSTCVIFDRGFDDILLDQRRYRLKGVAALARVLRIFVPKPHVVIALDVSAETARARTPELAPEEIERQRSVLRVLCAGATSHHLISAEPHAETVATEAGKIIVAELASRLR